jgi:bifunctional oligoribonuclease and PAP phosphatase NrnA
MIKEFEPGDFRVSLRSLGTIDVCEIASEFGGGGHRFAAGFSSKLSIEQIVSELNKLISTKRSN